MQHREIVGAVADRERGGGVETELRRERRERGELRVAPEDGLFHPACELAILDNEPIGAMLVEADQLGDARREQREATGDEARMGTVRPHGTHQQ